MGKSKNRKKAQLKKPSQNSLPYEITVSHFLDALLMENIYDLKESRLKQRDFLNDILVKYFNKKLPQKFRACNKVVLAFVNCFKQDTTKTLFLERIKLISCETNTIIQNDDIKIIETQQSPVLKTLQNQLSPSFNEADYNNEKIEENQHKTELHMFFSESSNVSEIKNISTLELEQTPKIKFNSVNNEDIIEKLIDKMSPISLQDSKMLSNKVGKPPHVKRLMMDTGTSPFKSQDFPTDFPSTEYRKKGLTDVLVNLTENQLTTIEEIVKLFKPHLGTSIVPRTAEFQDISQSVLNECSKNQSTLTFRKEEEFDDEVFTQSPSNIIQISNDTKLCIWKKSNINNFYCLKSSNEEEKFWVNSNLKYSFCVRIQHIIYNTDNARKLLKTECFNRGITCQFIFEKSTINATALTYSANGHCIYKNDGCEMKFRLHTTKGSTEGRHFLLFLSSNEPVDHSKMRVRFPQIRGSDRDELKKNFTRPEQMLQKLHHIDYDLATKGNVQGLTTRNVLQTISSEINKSNSMIKCELYKLMACIQCGETESFGTLIVQQDSVQIIMIDNRNYELFEKIPAKSATMHADASGQVVKSLQCCRKINLHGSKKAFLVHANAIKVENETIVTASMVTNSQNALTLGMFYGHCLTQMMLRIKKCIFKRIVTDWAFANFIAILQTYNNMSILKYLNFLYEVIVEAKHPEYCATFIYLIICYSHFMKLISGFAMREITKSVDAFKGYQKKQKQLLMSFFAVIRSSKTLEEVEVFFKAMCMIFCNKFLNSEITQILIKLKELKLDEIKEFTSVKEDEIIFDDYLKEQFEYNRTCGKTLRENSKWYQRFKKIYNDIIALIDNDENEDSKELNYFYVPGMVLRSLELYFTYLPMWSHIGHGFDDDEEDQTFTNGLIESFFKYLKYDVEGQLRKRPTMFLKSMCALSNFKRTKVLQSKFFPKNKKKINVKRCKVSNSMKKERFKRKIESNHDEMDIDEMDASQQTEKWHKPGKTPKRFKYSKSSFASSIPKAVISLDAEKQLKSIPSTPETDFSISPVKLYLSDDEHKKEEDKQIVNIAKTMKLTYYQNSELVSTVNYYDTTCTRLVKVANFATYEWMSYNDMLSLTNQSLELSDVAMYCSVNQLIKSNNLSDQYLVYITNPLTSLFNGNLNENEKHRLLIINQWMDLFGDPNIVHICPFLISQTARNNHWVLAIIDFKTKYFHFFDSLAIHDGKMFYTNFLKFLKKEEKNNKELSHFGGNWSLKNHQITIQKGVTCGKHVLGYCYKYIHSEQPFSENTFKNVDPHEEALRFSKIIYENFDNRKNRCLRCQEILVGKIEKHQCLMCGYGIHIRSKCFTAYDLTLNTNNFTDYVCHFCVNYIKRHINA